VSRTLIGGYRFEVSDLAPKISGANSPTTTKRLFNADLALNDSAGSARPYLAEALPQLDTDSWRVFPDGRMETTYRLRPNLTWHDGRPLGAEDFAFAFRAYTASGVGMFFTTPEDQIEAVHAPDSRTIVIHWRAPYPDAGALIHGQLNPLPRHVLDEVFSGAGDDPAAAEAIARHPYWTVEYLGAGPFRLERWEPGSSIEGVAFDGHALGRPRIDRVLLRVIADENAVLTNLLARNVHYTTNLALRFEHAMVLRREWQSPSQGTVIMGANTPATIMVQFRPEFQQTPALLDVRVRRALAHTIDRRALNDGLFEGQGAMGEALVPPRMPYTADVERAIPRHPFDPQQAERLMSQAGFARDRDGSYANSRGERLRPDFRVNAGTEWERAQAILTDTWHRMGFDVQPTVLPSASTRDNEAQHRFAGIGQRVIGASEQMWSYLTAAEIGSQADRWRGQNRTGWSDPEFERLWLSYNTSLDRPERHRQVVEMCRLVNDQLPVMMMYYQMIVNAHLGTLQGPEEGTVTTLSHWNIHEWELR
jgi:peptide/nickel transport system substrate-binding protein